MFNLLTDAFIRTDAGAVTLPGLYSGLITGRITDLSALRAHQRHASHATLVQIAALALHRARRLSPPETDSAWRDLLLGLAPEGCWHLIAEDEARPAFMQPVIGETDPTKTAYTPDEVDVLALASNHAVKASRMTRAQPDDWLWALVSLQTGQGLSGRMNYGISRMNAGFGQRIAVTLAPAGDWGVQFKRDIARLIGKRDAVLTDYPAYARQDGIGLVWLEPWDGKTSLTQKQLDPYYVEICRRIRLDVHNGRVIARRAGSEVPRIAQTAGGLTGDPWAPINRKDEKVTPLTGDGWTYRLVSSLLDASLTRASLGQAWEPGDGTGCTLTLAGLVRGQGKTEGYHERKISIPSRVVSFFSGTNDHLGRVCRERVADAGLMQGSVLRLALFVLVQHDPLEIKWKVNVAQVGRWLSVFESDVDSMFFESAFAELAVEGDAARAARAAWREQLFDIARGVISKAEEGVPIPSAKRLRVLVACRQALAMAHRKYFPRPVDQSEAA